MESLIVSAHVPSFAAVGSATSILVQTESSNNAMPAPGPPADDDFPAAHATWASIFDFPETGSILARVIQDDMTLELVSLRSSVIPKRFKFATKIIPSPALFYGDRTLHVIVATESGFVCHIYQPMSDERFWMDDEGSSSNHDLSPNYLLSRVVCVLSVELMVFGLANGSLLRLHYRGVGDFDEQILNPSYGLMGAFTSLLPAHSDASAIISISSHNGNVFTLSRDRTCRLWTSSGHHSAVKIADYKGSREPTPGVHLLDAEPQTLLCAFGWEFIEDDMSDVSTYVLAFSPTPGSSISGGTFHLYDTTNDQLSFIGSFESSKRTSQCHLQDMMVHDDHLYTLWDCHNGESLSRVEYTRFDSDESLSKTMIWHTAFCPPEEELTPSTLERLLTGSGSMTEQFIEAIFRPGVFSMGTLSKAINDYMSTLLRQPGDIPPQLSAIYPSIKARIMNVVGCTITLQRDPHTGAYRHASYWTAYKRDWAGFIARCREIERHARWPVALGVTDEKILVIDRDRVGVIEPEDTPLLTNRRMLLHPKAPEHRFFEALWTIKDKLGAQFIASFESGVAEIVRQETAFSFADVIQDFAERLHWDEELGEGHRAWVIGKLSRLDDLSEEVRAALAIIRAIDAIKPEPLEGIRDGASEWHAALVTSYTSLSIDARYDLSLLLMLFLFFNASKIGTWEPPLIAEIIAAFRITFILRYIARKPGAEPPVAPVIVDDPTHTLRNAIRAPRQEAPYSLLYQLVAEGGTLDDSMTAHGGAQAFLNSIGVLKTPAPSAVTEFDARFCDQLRRLGAFEEAREMLGWLPRTPVVVYIHACLLKDTNRYEDAADHLRRLAGSCVPDSPLSPTDRAALEALLGPQKASSQYMFYAHCHQILDKVATVQAVHFAEAAISVAPSNDDTVDLWRSVCAGYIDLGYYEDACLAMVASPHQISSTELIPTLVQRMCDDNQVERLLKLNFAHLVPEVVDYLAYKVRTAIPRYPLKPDNYSPVYLYHSKVLYAWYISRGDYMNAAVTMYQRARKLSRLTSDNPSEFAHRAEDELDAYSACLNALTLANQEDPWVVIRGSTDKSDDTKETAIPPERVGVGSHPSELVQMQDIEYERALLAARIDQIRQDPALLTGLAIVTRLAQASRFDTAIATARSLKVDMTELFSRLTAQCLRLARDPSSIVYETADWLLTDVVSSWPGSPAEKAWRYLRQTLERNDSAETDFKYTQVVMEALLSMGGASATPPWLIRSLEEHQPEYLIRIHMRYDDIDAAIAYTRSLLQKSASRLKKMGTRSSATWLPYTLIDQVLTAGASKQPPPVGLSELRTELSARLELIQNTRK
ncbi:hypothetical protein FISHEDRAFT_76214 [Fistulina hepatica ATCC 64428]|uniref:Nucleoporin Nup120/160-domain-containing protein n=1 Tax=Fistulina hepatica ATCC 64428 TaxID=1128425 RepID=A0A0D7A7T0_9AGAR|nr:hypothetical protein FISHEDRAFT_76214 [Fistulina hepatica ATCC 64428]